MRTRRGYADGIYGTRNTFHAAEERTGARESRDVTPPSRK